MNNIPRVLHISELFDMDRLPNVEPGLYQPTFEELCCLQPALTTLAHMARTSEPIRRRRHSYYCANSRWYRFYKPQLCQLVGWGSRHPEPMVRSQEAYDVAYDTLYAMLPNCRKCECFRAQDFSRPQEETTDETQRA